MLKIVIVDDENDALEALEWKLNRYIDDVEVIKCNSPIQSIDDVNFVTGEDSKTYKFMQDFHNLVRS